MVTEVEKRRMLYEHTLYHLFHSPYVLAGDIVRLLQTRRLTDYRGDAAAVQMRTVHFSIDLNRLGVGYEPSTLSAGLSGDLRGLLMCYETGCVLLLNAVYVHR